MVEFNVFRNGRSSDTDVHKMIEKVWNESENEVVDKYTRGVVADTSKSIYDSFLMVQEAIGGSLNVKAHCCELHFSKEEKVNTALGVSKKFLDYLGEEYQGIAVSREDADGIRTKFIINAVSYQTGKKFTDNNHAYIRLAKVVKELCGEQMTFQMAEPVLFTNENNNRNNYITA